MILRIDNWARGLWTAGPPGKAPQGTLTRMTNVQVMDEGTVATRPGCAPQISKANTTDGVLIGAKHYYKIGTRIYQDMRDTGIDQAGSQIKAAAAPVVGVVDDIVFFPLCMKKYYNNVAYNWGIQDTPTACVAADSGVAGNLTGEYTYRLAFYNATTKAISALSPVSNAVNVSSKQVTLTGIPTTCTDSQANRVRVYRNQAAITSYWKQVIDLALGVATYTDNTADAGLGDLVDSNLMVPPTCTMAGRYKNRLLVANPSSNPRFIYSSQASYPEYFSTLLLEQVLEAGDEAEAIIELGDYAIVIGQQSVYTFQIGGSSVNPIIYTAKVIAGRGTLNGRTACMGSSGIYFLSDDGIYVISGLNVTKVSDMVDALFRGISRGGLSTISSSVFCNGTFVGGRYHLTYFGADDEWHTVIFNEQKQRWKHYTGWHYTVPPVTGAYPLVGLPNAVALYAAKNAKTDGGAAFVSSCGFNLPTVMTALMDLRWFRLGIQSEGQVTVGLYDNEVLKYSTTIEAPTFDDSYHKHGVPLGLYFTQPEVVISSSSPFTLKSFEADVNLVRKYEADYSRQSISDRVSAGGAT